MLDFKPTSSWQCPKGDDLLKEKAEFSPLLLFFLRVLLLHCSERPCKRGCNHGGTGAEMAKGSKSAGSFQGHLEVNGLYLIG